MLRLKIKNIISKYNLSLTKSREKVLRCFLKSNKPLELKEIRKLVGAIDRVTLFRILTIFEKNKIIHVIRLENGKTLYALCHEECGDEEQHIHDHLHFQCTSCDAVACLPVDNFPVIKIPNYLFQNININVSGLCQKCIQ